MKLKLQFNELQKHKVVWAKMQDRRKNQCQKGGECTNTKILKDHVVFVFLNISVM